MPVEQMPDPPLAVFLRSVFLVIKERSPGDIEIGRKFESPAEGFYYLRKSLNVTAEYMCKRLAMMPSRLNGIERGTTPPSMIDLSTASAIATEYSLYQLAKAFDNEVDQMKMRIRNRGGRKRSFQSQQL